MKRIINLATATLAALSIGLLCAIEQPTVAQETKITKGKLPAAIRTAFERDHPNAKIRGVSKEKEDGKTVYEVESIDNGHTLDIVYADDGTAIEVEEGIAVTDIPAAGTEAIKAKYPKAKILKAEKLTKGNETGFEVIISVGGKKRGVGLDANGQIKAKTK